MLDAQLMAQRGEGAAAKGRAIVGEQALDGHAQALVVGHCVLEELDGAGEALVGVDVGEGHAGVVIDGHEDEVPAGPLNGIASVARDPVARALDTSQLLDVDVQQIAGGLMLVAHHRLGRLQVGQVRQTGAGQDAADGAG
ncbi:hypothetical protein BOB48_16845 [Bordetella pertussis]|nr:hypothetical protein WU40_05960 [Bordetella pertussis]AQC44521.1 hypothetical protein WU40_19405 [Bordetella pertussis]AUL01864.1 hypothetical protein BOB48_16845 [Bordetella pertussis]CPO21841.1 Uncharacterised protein [Bordetella pertussis]